MQLNGIIIGQSLRSADTLQLLAALQFTLQASGYPRVHTFLLYNPISKV